MAAVVDLLDCLARHLAAQVAWDDRVNHADQADLDDPEADPTYARPVESEVLDLARDGGCVSSRLRGSSGESAGSTTIGIGLIAGASEKE